MSSNFTIVINSKNYISRTDRSSILYGIDWSFLPDGYKYKMNWRFLSEATQTNSLLVLSLPDIGASVNSFFAGSKTVTLVSNVSGIITNYYGGNAAGMYRADFDDNPSLYFDSKPHNNTFLVNIYNNSGVLTDIAVDYILIMTFEKISS